MGPLLFRLALLSLGMGMTEIGISAILGSSPVAWLLLGLGLTAVFGGSAGFIAPLLRARDGKEGQ